MWWKSPAKKSTKSHRIADRAILDYSRVRVKPGMCRDYPRAVLVQVAPTLYLCLLFIHPRVPNLIDLRSTSTMPS